MMGRAAGQERNRPAGDVRPVRAARQDSSASAVQELRAQVNKLQEQQEQMTKALQQIGQALDKISSRN